MKFLQLNSRLRMGALIAVALMLAACNGPAAEVTPEPTANAPTSLAVSGAGGTTEVVKFLSKAYSQQRTDLAFNFLSGAGSSGGVQGVLEGQLDLGTLSRPPKDSELAAGIAYLELGDDRIVVATSPDVSVMALTGQQVKDIFLGKIMNWSQVGGPNVPISLFVRDEEDSLTQTMRKELFGDAAFAPGAVVLTSAGDMRNALANSTNAIGMTGYGEIQINDLPLHALILDGLDPADLSNNYPYNRQLGVAYLPANVSKVQSFLDFVASPEGREVLAGVGIVAH